LFAVTTLTPLQSVLSERIAAVRERIAAAERVSGRPPGSVRLVGVSKTVGREEVDAAYAAGLREFGENRVQDAREKFAVDAPDDVVLHLIGSLQTNKVRHAVGMFGLIHSVDRASLVTALAARAQAQGIVQPVLIQVNIAEEEQKHGCRVDEAQPLLELISTTPGLALQGLMTMAPLVATAEQARPVFVALRELRDRLQRDFPEAGLQELSMGMTNDYVAAVEEGATIVRVGRAIFADWPGG
jgi:pyridoxal phosphate enzyme (YggS family)